MLDFKDITTEKKSTFNGLINRLDVAEERMSLKVGQ